MNKVSKQIIRKLKEIAKGSPLNFNELRVIVALERIITRIDSSSTAKPQNSLKNLL